MSVICVPPKTPLLYSKTGVCRVIPIFLIFAPKHRLCVHVRTASNDPTNCVLSKNKENIKNVLPDRYFSFFYKFKNVCLLRGQVFVISKKR